MATLLLADHRNGRLSEHTARALSAALAIDTQVDVLLVGSDALVVAKEAAGLRGVSRVLAASSSTYDHCMAEPVAALIASLANSYQTLMASATAAGKGVMPRVSALLDVAQISEIIEVVAPDTFKRSAYAGNVVQTVRTRERKTLLTVRTSAFPAAGVGNDAVIVEVTTVGVNNQSLFVSEAVASTERPNMASARVVVSGGRGLGSKDDFERLIFPLADKLGAAVGASRAAVDAGYAPNDWQVGQTGKVVAPDLYVAVGISGAIQHIAGMKDSRVIVAINKDAEAPIFQIADYGLVGDLFELLPQLSDLL